MTNKLYIITITDMRGIEYIYNIISANMLRAENKAMELHNGSIAYIYTVEKPLP